MVARKQIEHLKYPASKVTELVTEELQKIMREGLDKVDQLVKTRQGNFLQAASRLLNMSAASENIFVIISYIQSGVC